MNKTLKAALAAALVVSASGAARADLTYQGAVGLPLNPTASIPNQGGWRLQGNFHDFKDGDKFYGAHLTGSLAESMEVGVGFNKLDSDSIPALSKTGVSANAKYLFTHETDPAGIRIAVGAGYQDALAKNWHAYVVGSKTLEGMGKGNVTGHLGLRYDRFDFSRAGGGDANKASAFAGVEWPFTETGDWTAVGEIQSKNISGGDVPYSASVRYRPSAQPFSVSVGVARQGIGRGGVFAQVGYTFDTGH